MSITHWETPSVYSKALEPDDHTVPAARQGIERAIAECSPGRARHSPARGTGLRGLPKRGKLAARVAGQSWRVTALKKCSRLCRRLPRTEHYADGEHPCDSRCGPLRDHRTIPAYPFWALTIIAVDVVALYGLCAYGSRENLAA
jgi:hypothetical protein